MVRRAQARAWHQELRERNICRPAARLKRGANSTAIRRVSLLRPSRRFGRVRKSVRSRRTFRGRSSTLKRSCFASGTSSIVCSPELKPCMRIAGPERPTGRVFIFCPSRTGCATSTRIPGRTGLNQGLHATTGLRNRRCTCLRSVHGAIRRASIASRPPLRKPCAPRASRGHSLRGLSSSSPVVDLC